MKTILAPNAPWPAPALPPEPKAPKTPKAVKPSNPCAPKVTKVVPAYRARLMKVYFDATNKVLSMEPVALCYTARIEGCHDYKGQPANIFNEGFRAAERIYGIGKRAQRTK